MRYAVNVSMLTSYKDELHPVRLLLQPVLTDDTVTVEPDNFSGVAALLDDSEPERTEAIVTLLRMKLERRELKMYRSNDGVSGWKQI